MSDAFKNEEEVVKGMQDLLRWHPMTPAGTSVITSSLSLIEHLQGQHREITESSFWKLRKFAENVLNVVPPDHVRVPKRNKEIFSYNYPEGVVYVGYAADPEQELPPIIMKASMADVVNFTSCITELTVEEAAQAIKGAHETIQIHVFGKVLKDEPITAQTPAPDWEFTTAIEDNPFESSFRITMMDLLKETQVFDATRVYEEFKDKFNLSHILNHANRQFMDFHVYCVKDELHWEWKSRE